MLPRSSGCAALLLEVMILVPSRPVRVGVGIRVRVRVGVRARARVRTRFRVFLVPAAQPHVLLTVQRARLAEAGAVT